MSKNCQENNPYQCEFYEIKIKGHLDKEWISWFEGLTLTHEGDGNTLITGPIADQAALYASLKRVHQLGLELISVNRTESQND